MSKGSKNRKFKLYTHQFLYLPVSGKQHDRSEPSPKQASKLISTVMHLCYLVGLGVIKSVKFAALTCYNACFHIGRTCVNLISGIYRLAANELDKTRQSVSKRYQRLLDPQFRNAVAIFAIIACVSSLGFGSVWLVAKGLDLKGQVLGLATSGGKNLMAARESLKQQDLEAAGNKFTLAYKSFSNSRQQLNETNTVLNRLLSVFPQKRDAEKLFDAAAMLSKTGNELIEVYKDFSSLHLTAEGIGSQEPLPEILARMDAKIASADKNLSEAAKKIAAVDAKNVPQGYRGDFAAMSGQLQVLQESFTSFREVFLLTEQLMLGEKNVLVVFENNNELRATGGFIGTYGNIKLKDGKIGKIEISSIYDLDGRLQEKIAPPSPILNANDRWFMRDSNWFLDFPESAKKLSTFYEKEGGETPDLVLAMTPNLAVELLKLTGPIDMPDYNISLDADNFVELVQAVSTLNQGPVNTPKQVLADFFPVLLQKLSDLPANQWPLVFEILQNNLNSKQLAMYSRDQEIQKQLEAFNWAGKVLPTDRDYLFVSGSNLGGTKTDLNIRQEINLKSTIDAQGGIINELTITRTNLLPKLDNTINTSFIRILVPAGSELLSNTGFDYKNLDAQEISKGYKTDLQAYEWEKSSVRDVVSGTLIGKEAGKTFFGNWLTQAGGESKTVKLVYRLPLKLKEIDRYSLLLQKQMGSQEQKFDWSLDFAGRALEWKNFDTQKLETGSLALSQTLNQDRFFGAVLHKK